MGFRVCASGLWAYYLQIEIPVNGDCKFNVIQQFGICLIAGDYFK